MTLFDKLESYAKNIGDIQGEFMINIIQAHEYCLALTFA